MARTPRVSHSTAVAGIYIRVNGFPTTKFIAMQHRSINKQRELKRFAHRSAGLGVFVSGGEQVLGWERIRPEEFRISCNGRGVIGLGHGFR